MPTVAQNLGAQLQAKQAEMEKWFVDHKVDDPAAASLEKADEDFITALHGEVNDLAEKWDKARKFDDIRAKNRQIGTDLAKVDRPDFLVGNGQMVESKGDPQKSMGDRIVDVLYKKDDDGRFRRDHEGKALVRKKEELEVKEFGLMELKTTMTTSAGWAPVTIRSSKTVLSAQRPVVFMDILPTVPLSIGSVYEYMQETTFTNNAAVIAEAGTYPESALAYTPVDANVRKVGTWIPVTEEQLSDVEGMRALIDNRLSYMVLVAADAEILNGDGTGVHINGFFNQVTQSQAKGADPTFDAVFKAMNKVRTIGFANPDAVVMHPDDFVDIRLTRTADGLYIMGNPDVVGSERLFGLRVVQTTGVVANTALVGDFGTHSALITRWGLDVQATNSHDVNFIKDIWAIKARIRLGLAIYRLTAFCKVTGV